MRNLQIKELLRIITPIFLTCLLVLSCNMADESTNDSTDKKTNSAEKTSGDENKKSVNTTPYEKTGISFSQPEGWKVTEDEIIEGRIRNINVEGPDNAVMIITALPSSVKPDLKNFAENFKENLSSTVAAGRVSEMKTSETSRSINGKDSKGVRQNYSLTLLGQEVPHTTDFYLVNGKKSNAVLTMQASDEDFQNADKAFQTISDSLKIE